MSTTVNLIELREGGIADLALVEAIMADAFDPRFGEAWTPGQTSGMMVLPGLWLTVASIDSAPVGFALSRSVVDDSELLLLAVRPEWRGRGVGGALTRSVILEARARGATRLHLEVRAGNGAIALYVCEGFTKTGERRNYYRGRNGQLYDAHSFSRQLG